jgi:hypothetical protein
MKRILLALSAALIVSACADAVAPISPADASLKRGSPGKPPKTQPPTAQDVFARFVSLGTSNSMGVQSAGVFASAQQAAWPAQLASRVGTPFSLPLVQDPGCGPPLFAPLATNFVLLGAFAAFGAGEDLVTAVMNTCAPLRDGIVPPTNNVAISGANVSDALRSTPESETLTSPRKGELYSRVLAPGQTQVAAMLAQSPTFVSVELAANEVLPASTGRLSSMTPFEQWASDYDEVLAAVKTTGARAVLVGLPDNAANFPSIRRSREFFYEWAYLLTLGISVSSNCYYSSNYIFVPGYILTLLSKTPTTATCADLPGEIDYVLTASDITAINARMAQMNARMETRASENGYAFFKLSAVYDLPKVSFSMYDVLFSSNPFGPYMSLDGVHPNGAGQGILASAAVQAINARYGLSIP